MQKLSSVSFFDEEDVELCSFSVVHKDIDLLFVLNKNGTWSAFKSITDKTPAPAWSRTYVFEDISAKEIYDAMSGD